MTNTARKLLQLQQPTSTLHSIEEGLRESARTEVDNPNSGYLEADPAEPIIDDSISIISSGSSASSLGSRSSVGALSSRRLKKANKKKTTITNGTDTTAGTNQDSANFGEDDNECEVKASTKQDSVNVNRTRRIVFAVLATSAVAFSTGSYFLAREEESINFEQSFVVASQALSGAAEWKVQQTFGQLQVLSSDVMLYGQSDNCTWPFCTIPTFDARAQHTMNVMGQPDGTPPAEFDETAPENSLNSAVESNVMEMIVWSPIVQKFNVTAWENYSWAHQDWIAQDMAIRGLTNVTPAEISRTIYSWTDELNFDRKQRQRQRRERRRRRAQSQNDYDDMRVPVWQLGPVPTLRPGIVNLDLYTHPSFARTMSHSILQRLILRDQSPLLSEVINCNFLLDSSQYSVTGGDTLENDPRSYVLQPVLNEVDGAIAGFLSGVLPWKPFFHNVSEHMSSPEYAIEPHLPYDMIVDMVDACGYQFSYLVAGPVADLVSFERRELIELMFQLRDPKYDYIRQTFQFAQQARFVSHLTDPSATTGAARASEHCTGAFTMTTTPTFAFENEYRTNGPLMYSLVFAIPFVLSMMVFVVLDCFVQRRQNKVLKTAQRTNAIMASLFPKNVQTRLLAEAEKIAAQETKRRKTKAMFAPKNTVSNLSDKAGSAVRGSHSIRKQESVLFTFKTKPIADFFTAATIMNADLVGFTAWSSVREPEQVFTLLETIYHSFDVVARKRGVFKVETVGDCYVAVAGLPTPRDDHAIVMCRFALECLGKLRRMLRKLEISLGPDTSDLSMRFGLHSGPVTAGVLRGERSRFQLFGDTVNTASRIESTGERGRIHLSAETAKFLAKGNKEHWYYAREDKVTAKGTTVLQTYWLKLKKRYPLASSDGGRSSWNRSGTASSMYSGGSSGDGDDDDDVTMHGDETMITGMNGSFTHADDDPEGPLTEVPPDALKASANGSEARKITGKKARLVNWVVDIMATCIKDIIKDRKVSGTSAESLDKLKKLEQQTWFRRDVLTVDLVQDAIALPRSSLHAGAASDTKLETAVYEQLRAYVKDITESYEEENPFHNFEHVSHVIMSVNKFLGRITVLQKTSSGSADKNSDPTYGITSHPLTRLAIMYSAFIHDVRHPGVSNPQLIKEQSTLAFTYKNKSVNEQNSFNIAWSRLMEPRFADLRRAIYTTEAEFHVFHQLVVNSVMATDIMDRSLNAVRDARWKRAFAPSDDKGQSKSAIADRRATIIIEKLIQASDVAHSMQHWHVYLKWNTLLFQEEYKAYTQGRASVSPAEIWYEGEVDFFQGIVLPIANELKECGVFGVASEECVRNAEVNLREWESKGKGIVAEMLEEARSMYGEKLRQVDALEEEAAAQQALEDSKYASTDEE